VREKLQRLLDTGERSFEVARMARGDDPALNVVKTLTVEYTVEGRRYTAKGTDPETMSLSPSVAAEPVAEFRTGPDGRPALEVWRQGRYKLQTASSQSETDVPTLPAPVDVAGPWAVGFPPGAGAPAGISLEKLISLSTQADPGVSHFSGRATYRASFIVSTDRLGGGRRLHLDLGRVASIAEVRLNGKELGVLYRAPFMVDITEAARAGKNDLEVRVTDLWPNRMLGDEDLPDDSERNADGTLKRWPEWIGHGEPSPTGRLTFTSWRLWRKGTPLLESGLLGPVTLRSSVIVPIAGGRSGAR
jgi:hypothetical protein